MLHFCPKYDVISKNKKKISIGDLQKEKKRSSGLAYWFLSVISMGPLLGPLKLTAFLKPMGPLMGPWVISAPLSRLPWCKSQKCLSLWKYTRKTLNRAQAIFWFQNTCGFFCLWAVVSRLESYVMCLWLDVKIFDLRSNISCQYFQSRMICW